MSDENKSSIIQIDLKHVQAFLNEQERSLFMALLQTMDGKRRIEEFAPHDWPKPSQLEDGVENGPALVQCSECQRHPCKHHDGEGSIAIYCDLCAKKVEGDLRAESSVELEWNRLNINPNSPAGAHVNPCSPDSPDTVKPTAGEPNATHNS